MSKKELIDLYRQLYQKIRAYGFALSVINFDNSTIAPHKSLNEKAELAGVIENAYYDILTGEEFVKVVNDLYAIKDNLTNDLKREIELTKKDVDRLTLIPKELIQENAVLTSKAYLNWLQAKEKSDYSLFAPYLKRMIEIKKEYAKAFGTINGSLYNAWLDEFEEGMTIEKLDAFFGILKSRIVPLLKKIKKSKIVIDDGFASSKVNHLKQIDTTKYVLKKIGFDFSRGVISETEHPFTDGLTPNDVRITTHVYENMFFSNIFSSIHEGGHAIYEQNLPKNLIGTNLYGGTSMAIHESQSRFYENVIGRSEEFINLIYKKVLSKLSSQYKNAVSEKQMFLAANKVESSLIRTESDELTYSLHIMIRYEMEKKIIDGNFDVMELPKMWNELYKKYLGVEPSNDREGILQDSHWSSGTFGYFPSYALGNAISIQILNTMQKEFDVFEAIKNNNIKKINKWLKDNVYVYGKRVSPSELVKKVTGEELNPEYYCKYLEDKFSKIYELERDLK